MKDTIKVNEIFPSIQGEGRYIGVPSLFIRLSGCDKRCKWCDTEFLTGKEYEIADLSYIISQTKQDQIVWTGGEPTLQLDNIVKVIGDLRVMSKEHHLESNGYRVDEMVNHFDYRCFSPKNLKDAIKVKESGRAHDIKVVTDLESVNMDLISYATMLMPLSTFDEVKDKDKEIKQKVWNYCVEHNIRYTPRTHVEVWGKKRGV